MILNEDFEHCFIQLTLNFSILHLQRIHYCIKQIMYFSDEYNPVHKIGGLNPLLKFWRPLP